MTGLLLAVLALAPPQHAIPTGIKAIDATTPVAIQIALAESAGPPVAADAAIYVLGPRGYTKAREGRNGFTCLVSRQRPDTLEPECFDGEGTAAVVPVRIFVEAQRAAGTAEARIEAMVEDGYRHGRFKAPRKPGSSTCSRTTTTSSIRSGRR